MKKVTVVAPSNIAFIKYWGVKDATLRLPTNNSISMNLSNLLTTTTVAFDSSFEKDSVIVNDEEQSNENNKVLQHIERIRKLAKIDMKVKVMTQNNFPTGTGLSSSASGFAALTLAGTKAAGLDLSEKQLSILARQGSGSACRSIPDGFVEWVAGDSSETSYAVSLYPPEYWDIVDIVAVVSKNKKEISSTEGHKLAMTSAFFNTRLQNNKPKLVQIKNYIQEKNFTAFGELIEAEALELHAIYITSHPSLLYLLPDSVRLLHLIKKWRQEGLEVYFTLNTGQDVHVICEKKNSEAVEKKLSALSFIQKTIVNTAAKGTREISNHLF